MVRASHSLPGATDGVNVMMAAMKPTAVSFSFDFFIHSFNSSNDGPYYSKTKDSG